MKGTVMLKPYEAIQSDLFEQVPRTKRQWTNLSGKTPEERIARKRECDAASRKIRESLQTPEQKEAKRAANIEYQKTYKPDQDRKREAQKKWKDKNPNYAKNYTKIYGDKNRAYKKKLYYEKHPDQRKAEAQVRHSKRMADPATHESHNAKQRARAPRYAAKKQQRERERAIAFPEKQKEINLRRNKKNRAKNKHLFTAAQNKRRAKRLNATPKWTDYKAINSVYKKCREITTSTGIDHEVDHIVPLVNPNVCGLHIATNMRVISGAENSRKGNKFYEELGLNPTVANGLIRKDPLCESP